MTRSFTFREDLRATLGHETNNGTRADGGLQGVGLSIESACSSGIET